MSNTRIITLDEARRQYPHRYTMEHKPQWAKHPSLRDGRFYAPQYRTDAEWYENTTFPGEGDIPKRAKYCETRNPSWPLGQWLDKPYRPIHY